MSTYLTESDKSFLYDSLDTLEGAGVRLANDVEIDDIEDALIDELVEFRAHPLITLAALRDPEEQPMFAGVWCDMCAEPRSSLAAWEACAQELCRAAGTKLREFVVFPDPGSTTTGSVRVRSGMWDVADLFFDLEGDDLELELISAVVPAGATAVTVFHDDLDAHSVTLFLASGSASDDVVDALEAELASAAGQAM